MWEYAPPPEEKLEIGNSLRRDSVLVFWDIIEDLSSAGRTYFMSFIEIRKKVVAAKWSATQQVSAA